jgi:hypothetical protein
MVNPADHDGAISGRDDGPREPTMTLQRWRRFVDTPPASFDLLPEQQWLGLSDADREAYDDNRISYHSEMVVVATSLVREVARQGRLQTLLNRRETSARRMMILTGLQTTGKTTALKQLGRMHELRLREKLPGRAGDRIPVVYVSTPPKGSPRKLAAEFARFLGCKLTSGVTGICRPGSGRQRMRAPWPGSSGDAGERQGRRPSGHSSRG